MTKLHERSIWGTVSKVYDSLSKESDFIIPEVKGEISIVIAPYTKEFNPVCIDRE